MTVPRFLRCGVLLIVGLAAACAGQAPARAPADGAPSTGARPAERKAITIALRNDINALASDAEQAGRNSPPSIYVQEFINAYLTVRDQEDEARPQLAQELPSLETGTWKVLDDGRMEVTWKLRPGVRWHDGTTLTAEDVRFGWEVASDPATIVGKRGGAGGIERIEPLDATSLVMYWKYSTVLGGELGGRELPIFPNQLLRNAFVENKGTFAQHAYFLSPDAFVGSGAYRPVEWERDSHLAVEAFDGYFLGRPKIDRITFRFIQDSRTALTNVLAGAVDMSYLAVEFGEAVFVREEWSRSGAGTVWLQPNQPRVLQPQMRAEYADPPDLLNREVRRALMHAMNREEITEAASPGAVMVVDADGVPGTRIGDAIRSRAVHYDYDPARALTLLEGAGWRRSGEGLLEKGGQRFRLELFAERGTEADGVFSVMREQYQRIGIGLSFKEVGTDPKERVVYPGIRHRGAFANEPRFGQVFHSREIAGTETRYLGQNYSGYSNPSLDQVLNAFDRSVRPEERMGYWAEAWRIITDDLAAMPLYIRPVPYIIRKGITGPIPSSLSGSLTSNVHLWDAQ